MKNTDPTINQMGHIDEFQLKHCKTPQLLNFSSLYSLFGF